MKRYSLLILTAVTLNAADTLRIFDRQWSVPVAADWKVEEGDATPLLHLVVRRGPAPGPRRPIQFALTEVPVYSRLTVEADLKPEGQSMMIVFAYTDPAHFDYAHLSTDAASKQPMHNGIFHVYGGERVRISTENGPPAFPQTGRWVHVRLVHAAKSGVVSVTVDGRTLPSLTAVDQSLGPGQVGLGSFDESGLFRNVRITSE